MTDNTSKLNVKKMTLVVIVIWVILSLIFGLYDLAISIAVVDEASAWGNFGAVYGELPGYGLIGIALATFFGSYIKNLKLQKLPALIIIVIGLLFLIFDSDFYVGFSLIIPIILYAIITWNKDWRNYRTLAGIISLLAVIHPLLFVQIVKILCGRVRFRNLESGFTNFTPWFLPPGISGGGKSFPSRHTAMSFMFIPLLIPLSKILSEKKEKKFLVIIAIILIIGWAIFVAASRVVVGAHYVSDVLFSGGVASIVTILLYKWIYVKRMN